MINLLDLDPDRLATFFAERGEKPYRARQVSRWIHQRFESDIGRMTDLARASRERLAADAEIRDPRIVRDTTAADGTRKWLIDVGSANAIETVYIPEGDSEERSRGPLGDATSELDATAPNAHASRRSTVASGRYRGTLCISSQAGCALDCAFCSTGKQGFNRNLSTGEIVGQLWHANRALLLDGYAAPWGDARRAAGPPRGEHSVASRGGEAAQPRACGSHLRAPITNVVMMGMGEPLANFDNVVGALRLMLDDNAYGLSRRRVTLSTSGLVPMIDRLRDECPVALAVSLHAPDDALRDRLVPINRRHPLDELLAACRRYLEKAPRDFVTFEYVMLDGVNDDAAAARGVLALVRDTPCKVNLIPFNPFPGTEFGTSPRERIAAFQRILVDGGIVTTIRRTRGDDIDAACGQLAGRVQDRVKRKLGSRIPVVAAH